MNLIRAIAILFLLGISPASANQREPAPPPQDPSVATIRGDIVSGLMSNRWSRVMFIDGRFLGGELETCDRHDLAPGAHSIVVAHRDDLFPLRVDAEAGDAFVVKWDQNDNVYVESATTGKKVFAKPVDPYDPANTYTEPLAGSETAVVKAQPKIVDIFLEGLTEEGRVEIASIDGKSPGSKVRSIRVPSGPRALAFYMNFYLGASGGGGPVYGWVLVPLLLDAKPGEVYALNYDRPKKVIGTRTISVWIENESTGEVMTNRAHAIFNINDRFGGFSYNEASSFPNKKGQLKRSAPKPKLWCERD
ncbi:hypothetical protein Plav_0912 [Parvibaculum lavamentivorans DS-1]|uniref:Uncharacterized protein n=1 Tax=Parvibaculum lavamentivorans (strain DS-1 / DSM 13023 / NCIMB 13966) TaxID=402881 RepID=A7HRK2_PARL1|nr:hypothetical protein [Parvibaculum lavamentivorans]ABS62535.1 hypothetical protein Plav_0912 [Parvibaculum lavamentivorans DS-1]